MKREQFRYSDTGRVIPALSLTPIWCWAILHCGKRIENRVWSTRYRGPVWLHAARKMTRDDYDGCIQTAEEMCRVPQLGPDWVDPPSFEDVVRGAFVGLFYVHDCELNHNTKNWRVPGQFGWAIDGVDALSSPLPASGERGLWLPTLEEQRELLLRSHRRHDDPDGNVKLRQLLASAYVEEAA